MNVHTKISTGTHDVWTDATKRHAAELWNGGATAKQIAEKLGVSRSVIVGLAHRNKDTFKPKMDGQPRTKPRNIHKARMEAVKREAGEFKARDIAAAEDPRQRRRAACRGHGQGAS